MGKKKNKKPQQQQSADADAPEAEAEAEAEAETVSHDGEEDNQEDSHAPVVGGEQAAEVTSAPPEAETVAAAEAAADAHEEEEDNSSPVPTAAVADDKATTKEQKKEQQQEQERDIRRHADPMSMAPSEVEGGRRGAEEEEEEVNVKDQPLQQPPTAKEDATTTAAVQPRKLEPTKLATDGEVTKKKEEKEKSAAVDDDGEDESKKKGSKDNVDVPAQPTIRLLVEYDPSTLAGMPLEEYEALVEKELALDAAILQSSAALGGSPSAASPVLAQSPLLLSMQGAKVSTGKGDDDDDDDDESPSSSSASPSSSPTFEGVLTAKGVTASALRAAASELLKRSKTSDFFPDTLFQHDKDGGSAPPYYSSAASIDPADPIPKFVDDDFLWRTCVNRRFDMASAAKRALKFSTSMLECSLHSLNSLDNDIKAGLELGVWHWPTTPDEVSQYRNKDGRLLSTIWMSRIDWQKVTIAQFKKTSLFAFIQMCRCHPYSPQTRGVCFSMSMDGVAMSMVKMDFETFVSRVMQGVLPLRIGAVYAANEPWFFSHLLWPLFKLLLKKKLRDRIYWYGHKDFDKSVHLEYKSNLEIIPSSFGGHFKFTDDDINVFVNRLVKDAASSTASADASASPVSPPKPLPPQLQAHHQPSSASSSAASSFAF